MSVELIDEFVDRAKISGDKEFLSNALRELYEQFQKLKEIKISLNGASGFKDVINGAKDLSGQMDVLKKSTKGFGDVLKESEAIMAKHNGASKEVVRNAKTIAEAKLLEAKAEKELASARAKSSREAEKKPKLSVNDSVLIETQKEQLRQRQELIRSGVKLAASETQEAKAIAITKNELQQKNRELKNTVREETAARGSIEQLRASLIRFQIQYDKLSARDRNSLVGQQLRKTIADTSASLKTLEGQTGRFQRDVGNYQKGVAGLKGGIDQLASAYLGLISIQKLFDFLGSSVDAFNEAEDAGHRFKNTLENAGRTDVLETMTQAARDLMNEFKTIDDEDVLGVFDKLITYGKLTENQIRQLTPVIINFAAKQKISLADSAGVIIKAMEGNARALKEYGIELKASSSTSEAFGIIMRDLAPKVEGAAKAFGETTRGQIQATRVEIENLKEEIGKNLQPIVKGFWSILSDGLKGIPQIFESIMFTVRATINSLITVGQLAKAVLSLDFDEVKNITERIRLNKERAASEREYAQIKIDAQAIANDAAKKSEEEQNKILQENIALREASISVYKRLFAEGKQLTRDGKNAAANMIKDIETVNRLEKIIAQTKDKRVIGPPGGSSDQDETPIRRIDQRFDDTELRRRADALRQLSEVESFYFQERINNRNESYQKEIEIIEGLRAVEIANATAKLNEEKNKKGAGANDMINATNEFNEKVKDINRKSNADLLKQHDAFNSDVLKIRQKGTQQQLDQEKADNQLFIDEQRENFDKQIDAVEKDKERRIKNAAQDKDILIEALNRSYQEQVAAAGDNQKKREKIDREYAAKRAEIEYQHAAATLKIEIDTAERIIALRKALGFDVTAAEKVLAEAKMAYSDLQTNYAIANNNREKKSHEEKYAAIIDGIEKAKKLANDFADLIGGLMSADIDRQKNKLQEQSDQIEKNKEAELRAIEATTLSAQDKAAKIVVAEAKAASQKEIIAQRQRKLDQQKAKFDKDRNVMNITLEAALSVMRALSDYTVPYAVRVGYAIAAGAVGAAKLAVAFATPIPKYRHGTSDALGGFAIVGDGGKKEIIVTPTGDRYITPEKPTLVNIPKHSRVLPDANEVLESVKFAAFKNIALTATPVKENGYEAAMTQAITNELKNVSRMIQNKRESTFIFKNGEWKTFAKDGNIRTEYLNKNVFDR